MTVLAFPLMVLLTLLFIFESLIFNIRRRFRKKRLVKKFTGLLTEKGFVCQSVIGADSAYTSFIYRKGVNEVIVIRDNNTVTATVNVYLLRGGRFDELETVLSLL